MRKKLCSTFFPLWKLAIWLAIQLPPSSTLLLSLQFACGRKTVKVRRTRTFARSWPYSHDFSLKLHSQGQRSLEGLEIATIVKPKLFTWIGAIHEAVHELYPSKTVHAMRKELGTMSKNNSRNDCLALYLLLLWLLSPNTVNVTDVAGQKQRLWFAFIPCIFLLCSSILESKPGSTK